MKIMEVWQKCLDFINIEDHMCFYSINFLDVEDDFPAPKANCGRRRSSHFLVQYSKNLRRLHKKYYNIYTMKISGCKGQLYSKYIELY